MFHGQWLLWLTVALLAVNLAATFPVYRRRDDAEALRAGSRPASEVRAGGDEDTVVCPSCGAENESEYRFCRDCVGELPGAAAVRRRPDSPGTLTR